MNLSWLKDNFTGISFLKTCSDTDNLVEYTEYNTQLQYNFVVMPNRNSHIILT